MRLLGFLFVFSICCGLERIVADDLAQNSLFKPGKPQTTAFFETDSALNVFGDEARITENPEISYFPAQPSYEADFVQNYDGIPSSLRPEGGSGDDALKDALFKKYGDPSKPAPIVAVENAPTPFKGMMAALEAKREDIAAEYAHQYVEHLKNLRHRSDAVLKLTKEAIAGEEHKEELVDSSEGGEDAENFSFTHTSIPHEPESKALTQPQSSEATIRAAIRARYAGKLPVDPQGKVDVYFFFNSHDPSSQQAARVINQLYRRKHASHSFHLIGMQVSQATPEDEKAFRSLSGATFPIQSGAKLAQIIGIRHIPATVFVAQTLGAKHVEYGVSDPRVLEEIVNSMEGAHGSQ